MRLSGILRTRVLLVALLVAVLLVVSVGPLTASAASPCYPCPRYHVVCWGETLTRIAWMYGTTVSAIASANGIWNPNFIYAGQVLTIPCGPCPPPPPPPPAGCRYYHTVQWGQNLYRISLWYGSSMWAIASANGIWNVNYIRAGQTLCIP